MTREEAIEILRHNTDLGHGVIIENESTRTIYEAIDMAINALEQEPKIEQFANWVATEIFDDMWEYNKDAFAELACRKLAKLGIVRAEGDEWILVEPKESEEEE
jgi:hypothetical protein